MGELGSTRLLRGLLTSSCCEVVTWAVDKVVFHGRYECS